MKAVIFLFQIKYTLSHFILVIRFIPFKNLQATKIHCMNRLRSQENLILIIFQLANNTHF